MNLLEAVNTVLPYIGAHVVTSIENTTHPTVSLIVRAIDRQRKSLITRGWWFNTVVEELPVTVDGRINVPTYTVSLYGLDNQVEIQGNYLFDLTNNTRYFKQPTKVKLVKDTSFEELPYYAQMVVVYRACAEVYIQDYEYNNTVQILNSIVAENMRDLQQEDIRKMKYNITNTYASKFKSMRRPYR